MLNSSSCCCAHGATGVAASAWRRANLHHRNARMSASDHQAKARMYRGPNPERVIARVCASPLYNGSRRSEPVTCVCFKRRPCADPTASRATHLPTLRDAQPEAFERARGWPKAPQERPCFSLAAHRETRGLVYCASDSTARAGRPTHPTGGELLVGAAAGEAWCCVEIPRRIGKSSCFGRTPKPDFSGVFPHVSRQLAEKASASYQRERAWL